MATVTNTVKLPDGSTPDRVDVVIELVASATGKAAGWITATDVTLEATVRPTVTNGAWTASLTPNADITPSGSVYKVTEYVDKTRYIHYITVGSGGGSLFDLLVDAPASVASAALTSHLSLDHGNSVYADRYGADPTGVADSTSALAAALTAANGVSPVVLSSGTYKVGTSASVVLSANGSTLVGQGDLTVLTCSQSRTIVEITGDNCLVADLKIVGTGGGGGQSGVYAHDCDGPTTRNVTVSGTGYDGILYLEAVSNGTITGCRVLDTGDDGINVGGGAKRTVTDCRVVNNFVSGCAADGIHVSVTSNRTIVASNTVIGCDSGVGFHLATDSTVVGNSIYNCTSYGIHNTANATDGAVVNGNTIVGCGQGMHFGGPLAQHMVITGNRVVDATTYGIVFSLTSSASVDALVAENEITGGCSTAAIYAARTNDLQISRNVIQGVAGYGVQTGASTSGCANLAVTDNVFRACTGNAVDIGDSTLATFCNISRNLMTGGSGRGVAFRGAAGFRIQGNTISGASDIAISMSVGSARSGLGLVKDNTISGGCTNSGVYLNNYDDVLVSDNIATGITASTKGVTYVAGSRVRVLDNLATLDNVPVAYAGLARRTPTSATTLGSVTNRLPLNDTAGTLIGYIPIYNSIT